PQGLGVVAVPQLAPKRSSAQHRERLRLRTRRRRGQPCRLRSSAWKHWPTQGGPKKQADKQGRQCQKTETHPPGALRRELRMRCDRRPAEPACNTVTNRTERG